MTTPTTMIDTGDIDAKFAEIDGRLADHDARLAEIDGRLADHDARIVALEGTTEPPPEPAPYDPKTFSYGAYDDWSYVPGPTTSGIPVGSPPLTVEKGTNGIYVVTTPGAVFDLIDFQCEVQFRVVGVVISRCRIRGNTARKHQRRAGERQQLRALRRRGGRDPVRLRHRTGPAVGVVERHQQPRLRRAPLQGLELRGQLQRLGQWLRQGERRAVRQLRGQPRDVLAGPEPRQRQPRRQDPQRRHPVAGRCGVAHRREQPAGLLRPEDRRGLPHGRQPEPGWRRPEQQLLAERVTTNTPRPRTSTAPCCRYPGRTAAPAANWTCTTTRRRARTGC